LHLARRAGPDWRRGVGTGDHAESSALGRIGPLRIRRSYLRPIRQVKDVAAKADRPTLAQRNPLLKRCVDLPDPRGAQQVAARVAPNAVLRRGEGVRIEPQLNRLPRGGIKVLAGDIIRALAGVDSVGQSGTAAAESHVQRQSGANSADAAELPSAEYAIP